MTKQAVREHNPPGSGHTARPSTFDLIALLGHEALNDPHGELLTYPDATVICGPIARDLGDEDTALNPTLVVEVTSPSSAGYDRGEKLERYQGVPMLSAVLIVSHEEPLLELWARCGPQWTFQRAGPGMSVDLASIGCTLAVDEVHAGIK